MKPVIAVESASRIAAAVESSENDDNDHQEDAGLRGRTMVVRDAGEAAHHYTILYP